MSDFGMSNARVWPSEYACVRGLLFGILVLLIGVSSGSSAIAQGTVCESRQLYYKGYVAYYEQDCAAMSQYFYQAFEQPKFGDQASCYNAASLAIRCGDHDLARYLMSMALTRGATVEDLEKVIAHEAGFDMEVGHMQPSKPPVTDSLLEMELEFLHQRDQYVRGSTAYSSDFMRTVDAGNFSLFVDILKRYNGFPPRDQVSYRGRESIELLLHHLDIEQLAEIFPYIIDAIADGYMIGETVLYQIDRNVVSDGKVYVYDAELGSIRYSHTHEHLPNSIIYPEYYGGMDVFMGRELGQVWWPFAYDKVPDEVDKLRSILCLDALSDYKRRMPYVKTLSVADFLSNMK